MTTAAVSGILAALYLSDPAASPTTFTSLALADAGDHLNYQAAWGYRRWDPIQTLLIEKQVHGTGGWVDVTSSCTKNHLTGKVTFSVALNVDDLVRATGKRMVLVEVVDLCAQSFDGSRKMLGDASTIRDLFEQWLPGKLSWSLSADLWFVDGTYWAMLAAGRMVAEIYYRYDVSLKKCLVGWCQIDGVNWSVPQDGLQTSKIIAKGDAGLYWDTN